MRIPIKHAGCKDGTQRGNTHYHDKLTIKEFTFIRKIIEDKKILKVIEPSIRRFVDSMLSNSIFAVRSDGDKSDFVQGNDVETTPTQTKDQYGQDYGGKIMKTLPVLDRYKSEIAFGDQYRERIKLKIKNKKLDNEVRCFKRINALVQTRQMHGFRRTDKKR